MIEVPNKPHSRTALLSPEEEAKTELPKRVFEGEPTFF
jgi:hypothetical protein